jgi:phenylacetic acid degradation operon negative regulatory protein
MAQPREKPARLARSPSMAVLRPRSMLFTLYGDYAVPRNADVRLGGLVRIGHALGLTEVAVRSAVARLAGEGWMSARRDGNRASYALSTAGLALIEEGTERIYRPRTQSWDGMWCILNYSIPEANRSLRDRIRKRLAWLGFGPMGGGAYVSPRDVSAQALELVREFGVETYSRIFMGRLTGPGDDAGLARQCWDLRQIADRYSRFIAHYDPLERRDRAAKSRKALADQSAFVMRFALTHDFRRFPFIDPDLPKHLLPKGWAGTRARRLFESYGELLRDGAFRFFDDTTRT